MGRDRDRDRDRDLSRSPSYRRRYSRSPSPVGRRYSRKSRRDRSRSPYSYSRRRSRSISPRRRISRSPTPKRRKSRSPTPKRHKRQRSRSASLSPINKSPITGSVERKNASEKLKKDEEEKKRRQQEAELKLLEEETARRVEEVIVKKVKESLNCEEIKMEIQRRLEEGRNKLVDEVAAQLEKEKEAAVIEARQKEEKARKEKEELERMIEENHKMVEEAQRREALEQQRKEEERYRELEELQRQKEEASRRKKQQEEEEKVKQMKLLGKNKSRPKLSFAIATGFLEKDEMEKALYCMKAALSLHVVSKIWKPNPKSITSILNSLGEKGSAEDVETFVASLRNVVPLNRQIYHALLKAYIRDGKEVDGLMKRMKADELDEDKETKKILSMKHIKI